MTAEELQAQLDEFATYGAMITVHEDGEDVATLVFGDARVIGSADEKILIMWYAGELVSASPDFFEVSDQPRPYWVTGHTYHDDTDTLVLSGYVHGSNADTTLTIEGSIPQGLSIEIKSDRQARMNAWTAVRRRENFPIPSYGTLESWLT